MVCSNKTSIIGPRRRQRYQSWNLLRGTLNSRSVAVTNNSDSSTSRIVSSFSASSELESDKQEERGILRGRNPVLFALSDE